MDRQLARKMMRPGEATEPDIRTVGILYAGELGSALARILVARGLQVVTTLEGRSERTAARASATGLAVLDSVADVMSAADVLISSVPPASAQAVAERVASEVSVERHWHIYVDANSISPVTMRRIAGILGPLHVDIVDASIHGLASRLMVDAKVYLSGERAREVAAMLGPSPRTVVLGDEVGRASLMKMLLGGVSKGLVALLVEMSDLALRESILTEFWNECRTSYPGVAEPFERLLPTYPARLDRRTQEMLELQLTTRAAGAEPAMSSAAGAVFERAARSPQGLQRLVEAFRESGMGVGRGRDS